MGTAEGTGEAGEADEEGAASSTEAWPGVEGAGAETRQWQQGGRWDGERRRKSGASQTCKGVTAGA